VSILKRRKGLDERLKMLYGEETDGLLNYARTLTKQAKLLSQSKFNKRLAEYGLMNGTLSKEKTPTNFVEIDLKNSGKFYTTPDFAEALNETNESLGSDASSVNKALQVLQYVSLWSKKAKTVYSIESIPRNLLGGTMQNLSSGRLGAKHYKQALESTRALFNPSNKNGREEAKKLIRLGVLSDGFFGAEMRELQQQVYKDQDQIYTDITLGDKKTLEKVWNKIQSFPPKFYNSIDDFNKSIAFYTEKETYINAGYTEEQAEAKAAEITSDTMATWAKAPKIVSSVSKSGLVGQFATFSAEVLRNEKNSIKLILEEANSGNSVLQKQAAKRLLGKVFTYFMMEEGIQQIIKMFAPQVDEEKENEIRRFLPSFETNASLIYRDMDFENGKVSVINFSQTNPTAYLKDFYNILMFGDKSAKEKTMELVEHLGSPFLSPAIMFKRILEVMSNKNMTNNKEIYSQYDDPLVKSELVLEHLYGGVQTGTQKTIDDVIRAYTQEQDKYGNTVSPEDLVFTMLGQRTKTRDLKISANRILYNRTKDFTEQTRLFNPNLKATEEEKQAQKERAIDNAQRVVEEARKDYMALQKLFGADVAYEITDKAMTNNKTFKNAVIYNEPVDYEYMWERRTY